jgi:hypothetical protein
MLLLIENTHQRAFDDVLVAKALFEGVPPKPLILRFGQAEGERLGTGLTGS